MTEAVLEVELIRKCRDGRKEFYEPLVRTHESEAQRVALAILRDADAATDAVQEDRARPRRRSCSGGRWAGSEDRSVQGDRAMILTTSQEIHGRRVTRTLGLVRGNTIRSRFIGRDIMAGFRTIAGGEVREYTKTLAESREQAIDRMVEDARGLGADAIICVRFQTSMVMTGAAEIMCYGTAVTTEEGDR